MMAMPSCDGEHLRKCDDCGNVATHIANYGPAIVCKVCGSCDTRWKKTDEDRRQIALEDLKRLYEAAENFELSFRNAFPENAAIYTDEFGNRHEVTVVLNLLEATELGIPCRFENGNVWDKPLMSLTRKVGE
jgi:hypothetical protein